MTYENLPEPNIPLLRKAVEWAEAEAAKTDGTCMWHQNTWAQPTDCGTAYCIAGYTVVTAHPIAVAHRRPCACSPKCTSTLVELTIDGELADWGVEGQQLLGLTEDEADALFDGGNDIEDIRAFAKEIAERAGERL